jgi:hypothetical protein
MCGKEVAEMLWSFVIFALGLLGFDFLAARFGVNTRDGDDWVEHESLSR